ncbi:DUF805 domain-containing protein [Paenibacillus sp. DS2015]|uniref:DUF805 domain-containing protein n=1 Tax=Paenibacillus sp. DS2015 TaxID=3373917 RepID=UPI003D197924
MVWYLKGLKNYVGFQGRASRKEYWMFTLFCCIFSLVPSILEEITNISPILSVLYYLSIFLPSLAIGFRRLHDTGRSGWWNLIVLIPLIGVIIFIVFTSQDSQENDNRYGPNSKI